MNYRSVLYFNKKSNVQLEYDDVNVKLNYATNTDNETGVVTDLLQGGTCPFALKDIKIVDEGGDSVATKYYTVNALTVKDSDNNDVTIPKAVYPVSGSVTSDTVIKIVACEGTAILYTEFTLVSASNCTVAGPYTDPDGESPYTKCYTVANIEEGAAITFRFPLG